MKRLIDIPIWTFGLLALAGWVLGLNLFTAQPGDCSEYLIKDRLVP